MFIKYALIYPKSLALLTLKDYYLRVDFTHEKTHAVQYYSYEKKYLKISHYI